MLTYKIYLNTINFGSFMQQAFMFTLSRDDKTRKEKIGCLKKLHMNISQMLDLIKEFFSVMSDYIYLSKQIRKIFILWKFC